MAEDEMMAAASIIPLTTAIILTIVVEVILIGEVAAVVERAVVARTGRTETEVMASTTEDQGVEVAVE